MAFHYTLDSDNISYEETIRMIANAVFVLRIVKTARLDLHLINHKQAVPHYSRIAIKTI